MLRVVYTFFVGLFLAIFVGFGISVFYPAPTAPQAPPFYGEQLTEAEKRQQEVFTLQQRAYEHELAQYNRNISIIVMICAVVILAIALVFAAQLGIVANGLLLGGTFTLLYGIGRGMATDNNIFRFLAAAVGLAVTIGLGYMKFIYHRITKPGG